MLETLAIILIIMWILGMGTGYALGGLIHILLVIALIVVILRVIQGRRVV
ncbi:MAG: lmo0937 family membrane protein [Candidatus Sericytochromatia bacterium]|nr:lmo0937 family membrane protein [Candidatus Sericytochromatia bacterium]